MKKKRITERGREIDKGQSKEVKYAGKEWIVKKTGGKTQLRVFKRFMNTGRRNLGIIVAGVGISAGVIGLSGCETYPNDGSSTYHYSQADEYGALSALNAFGASSPYVDPDLRTGNAILSNWAADQARREERVGHARALQESVGTIGRAIENRNAQQQYINEFKYLDKNKDGWVTQEEAGIK